MESQIEKNSSDLVAHFPNDYVESRARFRETAKNLAPQGQLGSWKVPSNTDPDLTVDHLWLPPTGKPQKLLVILSGIHGSESYAGSAILNLFMQDILPTLNREHLGIFLVHAMNPYGFKNHVRCTENHVNLNRNFSLSGEMFRFQNHDSKRMHEKFLSRAPIQSMTSKLFESLRLEENRAYFGETSLDQLTKAWNPGQFERPEDLEYGGKKPEPQTQALMDQMRKIMPQYQDILALDLHTGLGHAGRLHLLTDGRKETLHPEFFAQLFHAEEDQAYYEFTAPSAEGFYPVHGATNSLFGALAGPGQRVCAITLEFGTMGHSLENQLEGLNISLLRHEGQFYGFANEKLKAEITEKNFRRSYPDDDRWREKILQASEGLFRKVLSRL